MDLLFLDRDEVQRLLDIDELLVALAEGFVALSAGKVIAPNRSEISVPEAGHLLVKPAWLPGSAMTVKLVSTFLGNARRGLPTTQALISLFDPENGSPLAIMDGAYLTAMRTAGCAALAAGRMARKDSRTLAIIGAGVQGQSHLKVFFRIRNFSSVRIASMNMEDARKLAATVPGAQAFSTYEEAVRSSDVVCLCTSSDIPVIDLKWLAPGTHVSSVGFAPPGGELSREIILAGRLIVETRLSFEPPPAGCGELSGLDPSIGTELGELISGAATGRKSEDELTVFKSMGHAMEDMVAANLVYRNALEKGIGRHVKL